MDELLDEDLFIYAKRIIDKCNSYNNFPNSEQVKEGATLRLTDYLIGLNSNIGDIKADSLRRLINEWINYDLLILKSKKLQGNNELGYVKTKTKRNQIKNRIKSIILLTVIASSGIYTMKTIKSVHDRKNNAQNTEYVVSSKDMSMEEALSYISYDKVQNKVNIDDALSKVNGPMIEYSPEVHLSNDALSELPFLPAKFNAMFDVNNPVFSQLAIYNFYDMLRNDSDVYREMDLIFTNLKKDVANPDNLNNKSEQYYFLAKYNTYISFVYDMLSNAGYDVSMYKDVVLKYDQNKDNNRYDSYYGLSTDEINNIKSMFNVYDEYIINLQKEFGRGNKK